MKLNRSGTILVASFWILAILSILAVGIGFRVSLEARLSKYNMDRLKALYLAKAGAVKTAKLLSKDTGPSANYDSMRECGIALTAEQKSEEEKFKGLFASELGEGSYIVSYKQDGLQYPGMMDGERRININTANKAVLTNLLGGGTDKETIADSIIYWRSTTTQPIAGDDGYYLDHGYECKHGPFTTIEELLLVNGVTPEIFNLIKDYITVYGNDDKLNINTAPGSVLLAVILASSPPTDEAADMIVSKIITFRNGDDGLAGTEDDGIFFNESDLQAVLGDKDRVGLTLGDASKVKNYFTTKSNYFRIESRGIMTKSKAERGVICVVKPDAAKGETILSSYREF